MSVPMKVAIVFDSPYPDWDHADHEARMELEMARGYKPDAEPEYQVAAALRRRGHEVWLVGAQGDPSYVTEFLAERSVELVWNAAEGFHDSDSLDFLLPAMLEASGYPYTGASPQGLMLSRNKAVSKKILAHHGVRVPAFLTWRVGESVPASVALDFPVIVKPLRLDGSHGISKSSVVRDHAGLVERVAFIHDRVGDAAIAEEFIEGRELYVSLLGNGDQLQALPTIELVFDKVRNPQDRIATRAVKWNEPYRVRHGIRSVFARPLSRLARERIDLACRAAFRALWMRDYARFDLRLDAQDQVWMLEANANPYICDGHELAQAARKAGMKYADLIEHIVGLAAERCH